MLLTEILVSNIKMRRCGVLKGMKNYNKQNTFDSSESTVRNPQTMPANPACPRSSPHNVTVQITST